MEFSITKESSMAVKTTETVLYPARRNEQEWTKS